jgi:hypothetical protein
MFMDIPKAAPADFQNATQRVYRSASLPSSITVHVEGAVGALQDFTTPTGTPRR